MPVLNAVIGAGKSRKSCYVLQIMSAHNPFLILLGGDLQKTDRLLTQIEDTRVIAADGGMRHARDLGVQPELWVGDFDSSPAELLQNWPATQRQPYPVAKNLTDGELAIEEALRRGADRVVLAGALGGERSDHALLHMTSACALHERGLDIMLTSGEEEALPLGKRARTFDLPPSSLFSILNFTDLRGLTIEGARYPLDRFDLAFGSSRTLSNVAEGPVSITLQSGTALLLARPYDLTGR
jgi:thiamine pyrophosphokinase